MNTHSGRLPTMTSSLQSLIRLGVEIKTIVDVGILTGTKPLMDVFPHLKHHLFEPVEFHFETISNNYRELNYQLHNVALSEHDGDAYIAEISVDYSDKITHSSIKDQAITKDEEPRLINCKKIRKAKLDSLFSGLEIEIPYLLKIDVDGNELPILRGAEKSLQHASVIVIEAPLKKQPMPPVIERTLYLLEKKFYLFDIVDFAYYGDVLWQVDLIFVRSDIVDTSEIMRPFEAKSFHFNRDLWNPISNTLF